MTRLNIIPASPEAQAVRRPALRYHGGKFRLAPWVLQHFPAHTCYVEPFGGAAGVLLQKKRSYTEVYNDLDGDIVNFFRVLRDPEQRRALQEQIALTPFARDEFALAYEPSQDPLERARRLCVRAQMGFGSAGATKGRTGFRTYTRGDYGTGQHLWAEYPESLSAIGQRFTGVLIENRPAIEVLRAHDGPESLHYIDPPYVHETRGMSGNRYYRHEMTDGDHLQLLGVLRELKGMVVISGYDTDLYHDLLPEWHVDRKRSRISGGRGTTLRTEVIWMNPACSAALDRVAGAHGELFAMNPGIGIALEGTHQ